MITPLDHHPPQASLSTSEPLRSLGCLGSCHPPTWTTKARWRYALWQPLKSTWNTNTANINKKILTSQPEPNVGFQIRFQCRRVTWVGLDCWMGNEATRPWGSQKIALELAHIICWHSKIFFGNPLRPPLANPKRGVNTSCRPKHPSRSTGNRTSATNWWNTSPQIRRCHLEIDQTTTSAC